MMLLAAALAVAAVDAQTLPARRIPAPEARQGAAVGRRDVYAIGSSVIVRYDKRTGERRAEWRGDPKRFPHLNGCSVIRRNLVCANSNYPSLPQWSAVEFFDAFTLAHRRTVALGEGDGSITWIDRHGGDWWAMFANYDGKGGRPGRDHRSTTLVRFDRRWRRTGAWFLPATILERLAPMSVSGGGWGPDGRLYLTGHDRPELYATTLPEGGAVLEHRGTYQIAANGQAIDWDETACGELYGIDRAASAIVAERVQVAVSASTPSCRHRRRLP